MEAINAINDCGGLQVKKPFKDSKASWYDDFVRNRKIITIHLHILHPAIRSDDPEKLGLFSKDWN